MAEYNLVRPCENCPFRTDVRPYLKPDRIQEMEEALVRGEFHCHKTLDYSQIEDWEDEPGDEKAQHCAGALILLEKIDRPSQMMRICERLGLYHPEKLDMSSPVYDSWEDMIVASEKGLASKKHVRAPQRTRKNLLSGRRKVRPGAGQRVPTCVLGRKRRRG